MAMNFFKAQDQAKRQTFWLVILFIIGTILFSYFGAKFISACILFGYRELEGQFPLPHSFPIIFISLTCIILFVSLYKYFSLKQGGGRSVAIALGGRLLDKKAGTANERRLLNIVEEMAIAASIPVPQTYILDNELNINAFAAGHTINDAVLGITKGSIELLTRDELQAVVGHEFSHILNGDMRLNLRFTALIFAFNFLSQTGSILKEAMYSKNLKYAPVQIPIAFLVLLALFVVGFLGKLWSHIMQAAVNRQREYLADASSVQFTRHASALASALKKIGGSEEAATINSPLSESYSHFFFDSPNTGLIATHPPLEKRIKRIEPWWRGGFIKPDVEKLNKLITESQYQPMEDVPLENRKVKDPKLATAVAVGIAVTGMDAIPFIKPVSLLSTNVTDTEQAMSKLEAICQEPMDSCYLMFALLTDSIPSIRAQQFQAVKNTNLILDYYKTLSLVPKETYIDFVEKAMLSLKNLSIDQYKKFKLILMHFIQADKEVSIKEWMLYQLITHQLDSYFYPSRVKTNYLYNTLDPLKDEITTMLSAIAYLNENPETQKKIFSLCANLMTLHTIKLMPKKPTTSQLTSSLQMLQKSTQPVRTRFLFNLSDTLERNKDIMPIESAFFRILSLCLDCPLSLSNKRP